MGEYIALRLCDRAQLDRPGLSSRTHQPARERDIHMIKLRQKVSGCLRTLTGAQQFCAIRSYLSTAAKHDTHFFESLVMLTNGRPWMPAAA
jgi:hypothetical protein